MNANWKDVTARRYARNTQIIDNETNVYWLDSIFARAFFSVCFIWITYEMPMLISLFLCLLRTIQSNDNLKANCIIVI